MKEKKRDAGRKERRSRGRKKPKSKLSYKRSMMQGVGVTPAIPTRQNDFVFPASERVRNKLSALSRVRD